jgi:hypothetical protein
VPPAILPRGKHTNSYDAICILFTIITAVCVVAVQKTCQYAPPPIMHAIIVVYGLTWAATASSPRCTFSAYSSQTSCRQSKATLMIFRATFTCPERALLSSDLDRYPLFMARFGYSRQQVNCKASIRLVGPLNLSLTRGVNQSNWKPNIQNVRLCGNSPSPCGRP